MKKSFKKLLSMAMMLVLLVNTLAVLAFAEEKTPYQEETTNLTEENLLLSMDDLKGTNLKVKENSGYTYTKGAFSQSASVVDGELVWSDEDGDSNAEAIKTPASGMPTETWTNWVYVGKTNIPLGEDKAYTLVFDFRWDAGAAFSYMLTLPDDTLTNAQYIGMNSSKVICANKGGILENGGASAASIYGQSIITSSHYRGAYYKMMLSIDGYKVGVYVDGDYKGDFDFSTNGDNFTDGYLAIGGGNRVNKGNANMIAISMTDIKVYNGAYTKSVVTNAQYGDLLMHFDDFDLTDEETFTTEYDLVAEKIAHTGTAQNYDGEKRGYVVGDKVKVGFGSWHTKPDWFNVGVTTNLPLNSNTEYTIEYYLKEISDSTNGGMGISFGADNNVRTFYLEENNSKTSVGKFNSTTWSTVSDKQQLDYNVFGRNLTADGYVRFTMVVDGYNTSLYAGGVLIGECNFTETGSQWLSICYRGFEKSVLDGEVLSIKDISIRQGLVVPSPTVNAIMPDGQTKQLDVIDGVISEFPEVTVEEGKTAVWTYSKDGSNVVAQTPFEVVGDVTLTAKIFNISYTEVAGVQYTTPAEGKQNVRFIATLHSLKGSAVGFEVTAKYIGSDGKIAQKDWDKSCNYVYTSINATTNGTVKTITAQELGGTYLVALSVDGVPVETDKQIDFYVKAYIVVNGQKIYSEEKSVSIVGGEYKSDATLLTSAQ